MTAADGTGTWDPATAAAVREHLLAFADDEHLMGQQHTEWIGVAPFLEEDLAFSSIGQDELGHAVALYELVCELDGIPVTDEAVDALAYRSPESYRSSPLVEFQTTEWAEALVRHWLYDAAESLRWELVARSSLRALVEVGERAGREETYHRLHADALLDQLLPDHDARTRLTTALDTMMPMVAGLLEPVADEPLVIEAEVVADPMSSLGPKLAEMIATRFDRPAPSLDVTGAGRTSRSNDFQPLMDRMREVIDLDPAATW